MRLVRTHRADGNRLSPTKTPGAPARIRTRDPRIRRTQHGNHYGPYLRLRPTSPPADHNGRHFMPRTMPRRSAGRLRPSRQVRSVEREASSTGVRVGEARSSPPASGRAAVTRAVCAAPRRRLARGGPPTSTGRSTRRIRSRSPQAGVQIRPVADGRRGNTPAEPSAKRHDGEGRSPRPHVSR
jgi:hypothetical protein